MLKKKFIYDKANPKYLIKCNDKLIESFVIDKNIRCIKAGAFEGCHLLKTLTIKTSDTIIEENAFPESSITTLNLVDTNNFLEISLETNGINTNSLKVINHFQNSDNPSVFYSIPTKLLFSYSDDSIPSPNLEEINVIKKTQRLGYTSRDGIYYAERHIDCTKIKRSLIFYPPAKKDKIFKVPDDVDSIEKYAFISNPYLETIIFTKNLNFDNCIIKNCPNLKQIVIPNIEFYFLESIENCPRLKTIYTNTYTNTDKEFYLKDVQIKNTKDYEFDNAKSFKEINNLYKER